MAGFFLLTPYASRANLGSLPLMWALLPLMTFFFIYLIFNLPPLVVQWGSVLWGIGCHPWTPASPPFGSHVPHGKNVGGSHSWLGKGKPVACRVHKELGS